MSDILHRMARDVMVETCGQPSCSDIEEAIRAAYALGAGTREITAQEIADDLGIITTGPARCVKRKASGQADDR